eukprot:1301900-Pleurochrysis_carterae.AAC.2
MGWELEGSAGVWGRKRVEKHTFCTGRDSYYAGGEDGKATTLAANETSDKVLHVHHDGQNV